MQKRQLRNGDLEVSAIGRNKENKPIPGITKLHSLEGNLGAAGVRLTDRDIKNINDSVSKIEVHVQVTFTKAGWTLMHRNELKNK
jgi:hypothetical protein